MSQPKDTDVFAVYSEQNHNSRESNHSSFMKTNSETNQNLIS